MKTAQDYITLMEHALGGAPDSRLDLIGVLNDAITFIVNVSDWKFRKRPPLDVAFQEAEPATGGNITSISRTSGLTTVTLDAAPNPPIIRGVSFTVAGVSNTSFNGPFLIESFISTTSFTYFQPNLANASSSGGTAIITTPYTFEQFIDLPPDFGELLDVCTKNNAIANMLQTSLQEIAWRRGSPNAIAYDGLYRVCLSFPGQVDTVSEQPQPRLEIWPRPTSTNGLDITLTYRAGAVTITDTSQVPNIPPKLERLLTLTARLFVQGYEEDAVQENKLWQNELKMAMDSDGRQQTVAGKISGGAVQMLRHHASVREFQKITDPANRTS